MLNRKLKTLFGLICALCLCMTLVVPAWAADMVSANTSQKEAIIDVLQYVESDKDSFNLSDVDFESIEIGHAIYAYEYTYDGFKEITKFFPLYYNSKLVALTTTMDNEHYQIETALARKIAQSGVSNITILYDAENCYLYDGYEFISAFDNLTPFAGRSLLVNSRNIADTTGLLLTDLSETEELGYYSSLDSRASDTYRCSVRYITQNPYDNLCWAAVTATIVNYVNGDNLNTVKVAKKCLDSDEIEDVGVTLDTVAGYFKDIYGLNYISKDKAPSDDTILTNLKNDYPIYGSFLLYHSDGSTNGHGTTIFAINLMSGYISVMDPKTGAYTANYSSYNGTYAYFPSNVAATAILTKGMCPIWYNQ